MYKDTQKSSAKNLILQHIKEAKVSNAVWTPSDFFKLGSREAVDKALQRMVAEGILRRIDRGLYDQLHVNKLTGLLTTPDYQQIIAAIGRRNQVRILIDGITAANALGLTNAVPGQIIVRTEGQIRPIRIGNLTIQFKITAPSRLYWAGRPAMYIVQALYWLRDTLKNDTHMTSEVKTKLIRLLKNPQQGKQLCDDLKTGLHTVPLWMQRWIEELLSTTE
ncbi:DUF6088 family protein [soil metagenome]